MNSSVFCDKNGCNIIIGYKGYNGRIRWYDGIYQSGFKSTCSKKHLREALTSLPKRKKVEKIFKS